MLGPSVPARGSTWRWTALRYSFAVATVALATGFQWRLVQDFGPLPAFVMLYPAVLLVASVAGGGPGIVAVVLSAASGLYFFLPPYGSFALQSANEAIAICIFTITTLCLCALAERLRRARWAQAIAEERELLAVTLASIGDAVMVTDTQGRVSFLNAEAERVTGWKTSEALGQPLTAVFRIINEESRQTVENPVDKVLRQGTVVGLANHTALIARDGREIPIDDSGAPVRGSDGTVLGVVLVFRDVTQRRAAEMERNRLAEQRQLALDAARLGWWHYDPATKIASYDRRYTEIFGVSGSQRPNEEILARLHPDDLPGVWAKVEAALDPVNSIPYAAEYRINHPDGSVRWIEAFGAAAFEGEGDARRATSFVGTVADITERKRAAEMLAQAAAETARQKQLLAVTLESIGDGVMVTDAQGRITFLNDEAQRLTGWNLTDAQGQPLPAVFKIINEQSRQAVANPVDKVLRLGTVVGLANHTLLIARDGRETPIDDSGAPIREADGTVRGVVLVFRDSVERKRAELERDAAIEFLHMVNTCTGVDDLIEAAIRFFRKESGCEAVGIRLREGDDYPYYEARGFPEEFLRLENSLCVRCENGAIERDGDGNPVTACMCGNVICGRFDRTKPFFTEHGSFWANDTTRLLATTSDADRQARTRNRCNGEGYESVALIALRAGEQRLGLLQLNDKRKNMFTPELIALWERLSGYLAVALAQALAETSLRESEQRYRNLFESMDEGFALCEMVYDEAGNAIDFRYLSVNPAFEKLTGIPGGSVLGQRATVAIPGLEPYWIERYAEVARSGRAGRFANQVAALGRHFEVYAYCPAPGRFAAVFMDVTERKRGEQELIAAKLNAEQARAVAESASKAKDHFLAVLSHELRNPLNPVLATASMLRADSHFDADTREQLEVICRNAELEARLIDDLLDVTRIERGKVELDRRHVELCTIIRRAAEVCTPDIAARKLNFCMDLGAAPCWVDADAARLQQVFWNLIKNAVKFTAIGGSIAIRVRLDEQETLAPSGSLFAHRPSSFAVIEVNDNGKGIEPDALGRIFNAFEQPERALNRQFGGLGLGLAISKSLVEMHGGTIQAQSEGAGKGATFTVRLPLLAVEAAAPAAPPVSVPPRAKTLPRPLRILLVEDHADTARIMRRLLSADGHKVHLAVDVASALRLTDEQTFDLLLSDLGLPDGSGLDVMRTLRAKGSTLPGIAVSGYGQEADTQASRDAGFIAHLVKPVNLPRLKEEIAKAVAGGQ